MSGWEGPWPPKEWTRDALVELERRAQLHRAALETPEAKELRREHQSWTSLVLLYASDKDFRRDPAAVIDCVKQLDPRPRSVAQHLLPLDLIRSGGSPDREEFARQDAAWCAELDSIVSAYVQAAEAAEQAAPLEGEA